jgi:hypothetical protein
MKQLNYLLLLCLIFTIIACSKDAEETSTEDVTSSIPFDSLLLGEWRVSEIELEYNSVNNIADSTLLVDILADTAFKAAHTITYSNNDTYSLLFDGSDESLMGVWNVIGDTALVRMEDNAIYEYSISREPGNIIFLRAVEDLDGDEQVDDIYRARYKRTK